MGLGKIGRTLGKEIIAWTRTGNKSILTSRAVKVNQKSLGYVHKNSEIAFQSNEAALNYSKNQVVKALKVEKPYEKAVVVKDNVVKGVFNGDADKVLIPVFPVKGCTVVHGHPQAKCGLSTPISGPDSESLIMSLGDYDRVIAYNTAGEYSQLSKIPMHKRDFTFKIKDCDISSKVYNLKNSEINNILSFDSGIQKMEKSKNSIEEIIAQAKKDSINKISKTFIFKEKTIKQVESALKNGNNKLADKILEDAQCSPEGIQRIHQFWTKFANMHGLEYKTNYSYLK